MTIDEAKIVAEIIRRADSGCSNCVSDLVEEANKRLPEFRFTQSESVRVTTQPEWSTDPNDAMFDWYPEVTVTVVAAP
jgi:hypothetical protein